MKKYALNLNESNRILSICKILPNGDYTGMPLVDSFPKENLYDYLYINNEFVYDPIVAPKPVETPSRLDVLEAKLTYTAMMTDTL